MKEHGQRKHSKFSASGATRWFNCPGSVELSEGVPDRESEWSREGTLAHELLEEIMLHRIACKEGVVRLQKAIDAKMWVHAVHAADFILALHEKEEKSDVMVETRIHLDFIHPEMFGTFDGAVIDHFGVLHVFDFKYGSGHLVSPKENLQLIFYAIGLAHKYDWNFKRVKLWIIQPRMKGYDGPLFWEIGISDLKRYVRAFEKAVKEVQTQPNKYVEGSWCHYCKGKTKCPLKQQAKLEEAKMIFGPMPVKKGK